MTVCHSLSRHSTRHSTRQILSTEKQASAPADNNQIIWNTINLIIFALIDKINKKSSLFVYLIELSWIKSIDKLPVW